MQQTSYTNVIGGMDALLTETEKFLDASEKEGRKIQECDEKASDLQLIESALNTFDI